jgi:hypothetical protein
MEQNTRLTTDRADLLNRLNRSDLIVRHHDGDENRIVSESLAYLFWLKNATVVNIEISDIESFTLQSLHRMQHGVMLNRRCDDVASPTPVRVRRPLDRPVVRFSAARCKEYFFGMNIETRGNPRSGVFQKLRGSVTFLVERRRISIRFFE